MLKVKDLFFIKCKNCSAGTFVDSSKVSLCEGCKHAKIVCKRCFNNRIGPFKEHKLLSFCSKCYTEELKRENDQACTIY